VLKRPTSAPPLRAIPSTVASWIDQNYPVGLPPVASMSDDERPVPKFANLVPLQERQRASNRDYSRDRPYLALPQIALDLPSVGLDPEQIAKLRPSSAPPRPPYSSHGTTKSRYVGERYLEGLESSDMGSAPFSRFQHDYLLGTGKLKVSGFEYRQPGCDQVQHQKMLLLHAVQRWRTHPLILRFQVWASNTFLDDQTWEMAAWHAEKSTGRRVLRLWREEALVLARMRRIIRRMQNLTLHKAMDAWIHFVPEARANRNLKMRAVVLSWQTPLRRALNQWVAFANASKAATAQAQEEELARIAGYVDHEEGLLLQDWDTKIAAMARVGYAGLVAQTCVACARPVPRGHPCVYHEGAARFHLEGPCFARLAQGVHYLALEKLDAGTMLQVDRLFRIKEYFAVNTKGYAYTEQGTYIHVTLAK